MAQDKSKLTSKQSAAITSLMLSPTIGAAAKHSGVSRRTLHRWLKEPAFAAALRDAQAEAMQGALRLLTTGMGTAATVLVSTMANGTASLKVRAALGLVAALPGLRQMVDFDERLAALEVAQSGVK